MSDDHIDNIRRAAEADTPPQPIKAVVIIGDDTFAEACRKADEEHLRKHGLVPEPPPIPIVKDHGVPSAAELQRYYELNLEKLRQEGVAHSTYDAVQYVLRHHGLNYKDPKWLMTRLYAMSDRQLRDLLSWAILHNIDPSIRDFIREHLL